ncbi:hypothetical protein FNV43_RR11765 [Rhamnella rubrinervis]|nr:hypothetical protein FNV43_RR11765 [Rhamnella rubrinervis]
MFFELNLNVMMRMIAGKRYYGDNVTDAEEARMFQEIVRDTFRLGAATSISDFLPLLRWVGSRGYEKKLIELHKSRDGFMQKLIDEHKARANRGSQQDKRKTMIEVLLGLQESEPDYYTDEIVRGMMVVLLAGGTDTSAGTMEWAMSLLLNHPEVLKKAQMELDDCVGTDRLMDESDLARLPYLHSVVTETLRMYPAGPLLMPHESSDTCLVGGFAYQEVEGVRDGFKLMPFGSGRRSCPGERLAMQMVGLGLGSLIQCFDWERVREDELVDMTEGIGLTMPKAHPLQAKCRARSSMVKILSQI